MRGLRRTQRRQLVEADKVLDHRPVAREDACPGSTGTMHSSPFSRSRKMPLTQEEAAALGRPGRMTTVGSRAVRPSRKPLRV